MPTFTQLAPARPAGVTLDAVTDPEVGLFRGSGGTRVNGMAVSGNEIRPGDLFAAIPGAHGHGAEHWQQAAARGAAAILTDPTGVGILASSTLPILVADNPRAVLGRVAARVYGTDQKHPRLFGITGTNGKTSTVHLLDAILEQVGVPAGHSSTADRRSGRVTVASRLTSPEAPELHALLARMNEDGVEAAALEVSAQALTRHRVDGLTFDVAGFTNLSHDHMDDFGSMATYLDAKLRLFAPDRASRGVVLLDSPAGTAVRDRATIPVTTVASIPGQRAEWRAEVLDSSSTSTSFRLTGPSGETLTSSIPLVGRHMAADASLAIVMLVESGLHLDRIAAAIHDGITVNVPGRTELVSGKDGPRVYTDFSHTPDSIAKTLEALRVVTPGELIVILGADGDKDPSKREPMGRAAALGADVVIVTDHHPRFEDPARIRHALLRGARSTSNENVVEIPAPSDAIREAVGRATGEETILWVGPGQTDYRVVRDEDVPYSPRRDARQVLTQAGWPASPVPQDPSVRAQP